MLAEDARKDAEDERRAAEDKRKDAEEERKLAEVERREAEKARMKAFSAMAAASAAMSMAEQSRADAEDARAKAEAKRDEAETARMNAETEREKAETARQQAADARDDAQAAMRKTVAKLERTAARIIYITNAAGVKNINTKWLRVRSNDDGYEIAASPGWRGYVVIELNHKFSLDGVVRSRLDSRRVAWVENAKIWETQGQTATGAPAATAGSSGESIRNYGLRYRGEYNQHEWEVLCTVYPYED